MMLNGVVITSRISRIFMKNMRKIQRSYNTSLLRKSFSTNQSFQECNKTFENFKLKQAKMQCDDGLPVYLKGGTRDKILFNFTLALLFFNMTQSIYTIRQFLKG
ncbi:cytochrome c oxidase subunit 7A1, mitochondrial [Solenopsis invicta]|uniref:cytochrome c oxidase subunit 7A1, mitochondrial n=1 Tax=Solenopsis invicta TaxID=13686 RepID=UPI000595B067|nr:cytochrome c oxidase subunit 7A1, mitochondrial [Solenopsis invicta]XP_025990234.1 cytochrome c oxidase subunit 7A1, mitochondrial [Solenopsis invicta]